jgi:hypothetical protein
MKHVNEDVILAPNKDYFPLYQKRISTITLVKILQGKSALQKTQKKAIRNAFI